MITCNVEISFRMPTSTPPCSPHPTHSFTLYPTPPCSLGITRHLSAIALLSFSLTSLRLYCWVIPGIGNPDLPRSQYNKAYAIRSRIVGLLHRNEHRTY
jgi:hypothetical protein